MFLFGHGNNKSTVKKRVILMQFIHYTKNELLTKHFNFSSINFAAVFISSVYIRA
jgi:hypothetical protein